MKKLSTRQARGNEILKGHQLTIGLDLGDRSSNYCILDEAGDVIPTAAPLFALIAFLSRS